VLKDHDRLLGDTEIGRCAKPSKPSCLGFSTVLQQPQRVFSALRAPRLVVLFRPAHLYYFARPIAYTLCHAMLTTMLAGPRVVGVHHAERCRAAFVNRDI